MPFGTVAPSAWKRFGSRRNSTTSCSSAFASSTPATVDQSADASDSGLISCGFVRGITLSVRQMKNTSSPMKMIGAQVMIQFSIEYQEGIVLSMPPRGGCGLGSGP